MNGYVGNVLVVDLAARDSHVEELRVDWARDFLGCQGLGLRYWAEAVASVGVDPGSTEEAIVLMTGPLTGTFAPAAQRFAIVARSPATGTVYAALSGGQLGPEIKYAGYDGIVLVGAADTPVYLLVRDDRVELKEAGRIWKKDVPASVEALQGWWRDTKVLTIGPAAVALSPLACVATEHVHHEVGGGLGATLASRNLKAVAVKGSGGVDVAAHDDFVVAARRLFDGAFHPDRQAALTGWRGGNGTVEWLAEMDSAGVLPVDNRTAGSVPDPHALADVPRSSRSRACMQCPLACIKVLAGEEGSSEEAPDLAARTALGSDCALSAELMSDVRRACFRLGLDAAATGAVLAWAMECRSEGLLEDDRWRDLPSGFGDAEGALRLVDALAEGKGAGEILVHGLLTAAVEAGAEAVSKVMVSAGVELPPLDPRAGISAALDSMTMPAGTDRGVAAAILQLDALDAQLGAAALSERQDWRAYRAAGGLCDLPALMPEEGLEDEVVAATGWSCSGDWRSVGRRIVDLAAGLAARDGVPVLRPLPDRMLAEPLPSRAGLRRLDAGLLAAASQEYLIARGWMTAPPDPTTLGVGETS